VASSSLVALWLSSTREPIDRIGVLVVELLFRFPPARPCRRFDRTTFDPSLGFDNGAIPPTPTANSRLEAGDVSISVDGANKEVCLPAGRDPNSNVSSDKSRHSCRTRSGRGSSSTGADVCTNMSNSTENVTRSTSNVILFTRGALFIATRPPGMRHVHERSHSTFLSVCQYIATVRTSVCPSVTPHFLSHPRGGNWV